MSIGDDRRLKIWDIATRQLVHEFNHGRTSSWAISRCGHFALEATGDGHIVVWNLERLEPTHTFEQTANSIHACGVSLEGNVFVSARGNKVDFMNCNEKQSEWVWLRQGADVTACGFTVDGQSVITASKDATVFFSPLTDQGQYRELRGHDGGVNDFALSATGREIVTASDDGTLKIWLTDSPTISREGILQHAGPIECCAFSPDSKYLISSASMDFDSQWTRLSSINLWDPATAWHIKPTCPDCPTAVMALASLVRATANSEK